MSTLQITGFAVTGLGILAGWWLGWQLLQQNGRMLLRLDELEKRLDELDLDKTERPNSLIQESEPADQSIATNPESPVVMGPNPGASRFSNGSLESSRINRNGLKAGTLAPDFRLPRLDGRGDLMLSELRGRWVLLVFSSPHCGPCNELAPHLQQFHQANPQI